MMSKREQEVKEQEVRDAKVRELLERVSKMMSRQSLVLIYIAVIVSVALLVVAVKP